MTKKNPKNPNPISPETSVRLEERDREAVEDRLPPYVYLTRDHFAECPACGRLYWHGTHRQAMNREIDGIPGFGNSHPGG